MEKGRRIEGLVYIQFQGFFVCTCVRLLITKKYLLLFLFIFSLTLSFIPFFALAHFFSLSLTSNISLFFYISLSHFSLYFLLCSYPYLYLYFLYFLCCFWGCHRLVGLFISFCFQMFHLLCTSILLQYVSLTAPKFSSHSLRMFLLTCMSGQYV